MKRSRNDTIEDEITGQSITISGDFNSVDFVDYTQKPLFSDLIIVSSENKELYFYKIILYESSDYFKALLTGNFEETNLVKISLQKSERCLNNIFNVLSKKSFNIINHVDIFELIDASEEYMLPPVKLRCEMYLIMNFFEYNLDELIDQVNKYNLDIVKSRIIRLTANKNFATKLKTKHYKILSWNLEYTIYINIITHLINNEKDNKQELISNILDVIPDRVFEENYLAEPLVYLLNNCEDINKSKRGYKIMLSNIIKHIPQLCKMKGKF